MPSGRRDAGNPSGFYAWCAENGIDISDPYRLVVEEQRQGVQPVFAVTGWDAGARFSGHPRERRRFFGTSRSSQPGENQRVFSWCPQPRRLFALAATWKNSATTRSARTSASS